MEQHVDMEMSVEDIDTPNIIEYEAKPNSAGRYDEQLQTKNDLFTITSGILNIVISYHPDIRSAFGH